MSSTDKAYRPYKPLYKGKPMEVAGYFVRPPDANFVALSVERGEQGFPIIFHEYTHLLLSHAIKSPPIWLGEGLAEYDSTFRLVANGRQAQIGRPIDIPRAAASRTFPPAGRPAGCRSAVAALQRERRAIDPLRRVLGLDPLSVDGDPPRTRQLMARVNCQRRHSSRSGVPIGLRRRSGLAPSRAPPLRAVAAPARCSSHSMREFGVRADEGQHVDPSGDGRGRGRPARAGWPPRRGRDPSQRRRQREPELAQTVAELGAPRLRPRVCRMRWSGS